MLIKHRIVFASQQRKENEKARSEMQCSTILHSASSTFCLQTLRIKTCSFQPTLKVTPPQPQPQQQRKTSPQEQRTSHHTHHGSDGDGKPKLITSVSNPFVKHCLKLRNSSSYRCSHGSALVVGATPIRSHLMVLFSIFFFQLFIYFLFLGCFWSVEVVWQ